MKFLFVILGWSVALPAYAMEVQLRGRVVDGDTKRAVVGADVGVRWIATDGFQGPVPWVVSGDNGDFEIHAYNIRSDFVGVMAFDDTREQAGLVVIDSTEPEQSAVIALRDGVGTGQWGTPAEPECQ